MIYRWYIELVNGIITYNTFITGGAPPCIKYGWSRHYSHSVVLTKTSEMTSVDIHSVSIICFCIARLSNEHGKFTHWYHTSVSHRLVVRLTCILGILFLQWRDMYWVDHRRGVSTYIYIYIYIYNKGPHWRQLVCNRLATPFFGTGRGLSLVCIRAGYTEWESHSLLAIPDLLQRAAPVRWSRHWMWQWERHSKPRCDKHTCLSPSAQVKFRQAAPETIFCASRQDGH